MEAIASAAFIYTLTFPPCFLSGLVLELLLVFLICRLAENIKSCQAMPQKKKNGFFLPQNLLQKDILVSQNTDQIFAFIMKVESYLL